MGNTGFWKYPFTTKESFELKMPQSAKIVSVSCENTRPYISVMVDPDNLMEIRKFRIYTIKKEIPSSSETYIGSYHEFDGGLVWYVYEQINN